MFDVPLHICGRVHRTWVCLVGISTSGRRGSGWMAL